MTDPLLSNLNPQQREAVAYTGGPMLVVAGAGSGKTRVITYKVAYLIDRGLFRPEEILAVTFTNKAAEEMKNRIQDLLGGRFPHPPLVCTFHSFCARFLRREIGVLGYPSNYTIYDADDQLRLVKTITKELNIPKQEITPEQILSRISRAKVQHLTPEEFGTLLRWPSDEFVAAVYHIYEHRLKAAAALDFDDLLLKTNEILERQPAVRQRIGRQYRYLLVDEFQDTNPPQFVLVKHLTATHQNICVVGDEDQSIYGFRGAILANILHFEKDFPGCRVFKLEENYRSTKNILKAASSLVANNVLRRDKTLQTTNENGQPVGLFKATDPAQEAAWVARMVKQFLLTDYSANLGVLYRTNFQSRRLEDAFRAQAIRYRVVGGLSFYSRKEIKDITAYMKLVTNRADNVAFLRVVNTPPRGLGEKTVEFLSRRAASSDTSLWEAMEQELGGDSLNTRAKAPLARFREIITALAESAGTEKLGDFLRQVVQRSGYEEFLRQSSDPTDESRLENIHELITFATEHAAEGGDLATFLDRIALFSETADELDGARVALMTLHGAKGLEFDCVFLTGLTEGLLPHVRSLEKEDDVEEERRLCYVGMTRARKQLMLSYAVSRSRFDEEEDTKAEPSRFLQEIAPECLREFNFFSTLGEEPPPMKISRKGKELVKALGLNTLDTADDVRAFFSRQETSKRRRSSAPAGNIVSAPKDFQRRPGAAKVAGAKKSGSAAAPAGPVDPGLTAGGVRRSGIKVGDQIRHPSFGKGVVLRVEQTQHGPKLQISFDRGGIRSILENLAHLERL